ncbi:MAG: 4Fe-4S binding protein [Armatimonadetes bacterium]|nr:4Fe-4S binding protein [Armatimonadota bacterium]
MRRQAVRKGLILVSFLLMPITLYYMSPALIIMGAAQGVVVGSAIVFGAQFISALLLGRAFCGWVCPGAGLQEACMVVTDRRAAGGRWDGVKYAIWVPWIGTIVWATIHAGGPRTVEFFFQMPGGISLAEPAQYPIFYVVIGLITLPALAAGRRGFCHYACWMAPFMVIGTRLRNLVRWPALHLRSDVAQCSGCGRCTRDCPMSLDVRHLVERPNMDHAECVLCGTCVDGCPKGAIRYSFGDGGYRGP